MSNKLLSDSIFTQMYDAIWCHLDTISKNIQIFSIKRSHNSSFTMLLPIFVEGETKQRYTWNWFRARFVIIQVYVYL